MLFLSSLRMLAALLLFLVSTSRVSTQEWENGELPLQDVDQTLHLGASGPDVAEAAVDNIHSACIFPSDKLLLRRYARAVTDDGQGANTGGGIWQISQEMLTATKRLASYTHYGAAILDHFGEDWQAVTISDMEKPLHSALAFQLYLQTLPSCSIPRDDIRQGAFVAEELPSASSTIEATFVTNVQQDNYVCHSPLTDIVILLDGSGAVGEANFQNVKSFVRNFTGVIPFGESQTRLGVIQYSSEARVEIPLNTFGDPSKMSMAVEQIQYLGGSVNDTGNLTHALWRTADMFSQNQGARFSDTGVSRIVIVLTLSESGDFNDTLDAAGALKEMGVALFAVGIGGGVREAYLSMIGSGCSHVTHLSQLSELEDLLPQIQRQVCKEPASLTLARPIYGRLEAGQKSYACYNVRVDEGFKLELSTSAGLIEVYLSIRTRNPSLVSHQWRCQGAMNKRGRCFIPPEQLGNLTTNGQHTVKMYAMFSTDANEGTMFYAMAAGNERPYHSLNLALAALIVIKMATSSL